MDDLVAFMHARLDEDEQIAQTGARLHDDEPADPSYAGNIADLESAGWEPAAAQRFNAYVAHVDPARAFRDVDANRRIVSLHDDVHDCVTTTGSQVFPAGERDEVACPTLRLLALPYATHPAYREDWRP